jgi:hypothetical protein
MKISYKKAIEASLKEDGLYLDKQAICCYSLFKTLTTHYHLKQGENFKPFNLKFPPENFLQDQNEAEECFLQNAKQESKATEEIPSLHHFPNNPKLNFAVNFFLDRKDEMVEAIESLEKNPTEAYSSDSDLDWRTTVFENPQGFLFAFEEFKSLSLIYLNFFTVLNKLSMNWPDFFKMLKEWRGDVEFYAYQLLGIWNVKSEQLEKRLLSSFSKKSKKIRKNRKS